MKKTTLNMSIQFKELAALWKKYNKTSTALVEAMGGLRMKLENLQNF
ncbi:hypothetical protein QNH98_02275 [Myroides sp. mNGS23_01]|nr:hypothetical protein [Myroides sp. mNGS23_01]WHT39549.1 hypothetical protein QNH98_02275 [Myroides sp. mNGS23_01]